VKRCTPKAAIRICVVAGDDAVAGDDLGCGIWSIAAAVLIRNRLVLHIRACGVPPREVTETFSDVNDLKMLPGMSIVWI
jgi:hypothetical protein